MFCAVCSYVQTLLDGEMVVDEDLEGNQTRRFLIYDLVAVNRASLVQRPWKVRSCVVGVGGVGMGGGGMCARVLFADGGACGRAVCCVYAL